MKGNANTRNRRSHPQPGDAALVGQSLQRNDWL